MQSFKVGSRVVVSDYELLLSMRDIPRLLGGFVVKIEGRHILVKTDGDQSELPVHFMDYQLSVVNMKVCGKLIRNQDSCLCPWCLEHGKNKEYYYPNSNTHKPVENASVCGCWHHTHKEHMPECPYR